MYLFIYLFSTQTKTFIDNLLQPQNVVIVIVIVIIIIFINDCRKVKTYLSKATFLSV